MFALVRSLVFQVLNIAANPADILPPVALRELDAVGKNPAPMYVKFSKAQTVAHGP